jgi:hypothetical protein
MRKFFSLRGFKHGLGRSYKSQSCLSHSTKGALYPYTSQIMKLSIVLSSLFLLPAVAAQEACSGAFSGTGTVICEDSQFVMFSGNLTEISYTGFVVSNSDGDIRFKGGTLIFECQDEECSIDNCDTPCELTLDSTVLVSAPVEDDGTDESSPVVDEVVDETSSAVSATAGIAALTAAVGWFVV